MLRITISSIFLVLFMSCVSRKNNNSKELHIKTAKIFDAQSGFEIQKMKVNNIEYSYELDKKLDTIKLWTNDNKFITKEGFKIGTSWDDIPKTLQDSVYKESGHGYFIELESGWTLGFCIGKTCTDNHPNKQSKVNWIKKEMYKRTPMHKKLLFKN
jgi:hypothetical protein